MKCIKSTLCVFFLLLASAPLPAQAQSETIESLEVLGFLLGLREPRAPEIVDGTVVFTAPSDLRRVGVAFADEGFSRVHWFAPLLVSDDPLERLRGRRAPQYMDSGISFHIREIPPGIAQIEYRLVINGLWTVDPLNPNTSRTASGATVSVLALPAAASEARASFPAVSEGVASFVFSGPPGETVTVAGSFNNWDPFMYALREGPPGTYSIQIPLPPGRHQYVFFHRGERIIDARNPVRVFSREGQPVSEIRIE